MSKKKKVLIVVIALLLCILISIFFINMLSNQKSEEENNVYNQKVDSAIDSVLFSDDYENLSIEEKKDRMLTTLYELEKKGEILKDSIFFQEECNIIWFQYPDGFEDGVMLVEFKDDIAGSADINEYVSSWNNGMPSSTNPKIDFSDSNYPFLEQNIKNLELSAKYMFGLCDLSDKNNGYYKFLEDYRKNQEVWNDNYLRIEIDDYCTIEDFKTGLSGYDIVFIAEHGALRKKVPMLLTREKYDKNKYQNDLYYLDTYKEKGTRYWIIKPSFFEKYYCNNKLKDTIIWISSCHGYQYNNLVDAFVNCGAEAVIGYNEIAECNYDKYLQEGFMYSLMYGETVSEALDFSKKVWQSNQKEFFNKYGISKVKKPTEAKIHPYGLNYKLIKLVENKSNENRQIQIAILIMEANDVKTITNKDVEITVSNSQLNCISTKAKTNNEGIVMFEFDTNTPDLVAKTDITLHIDGYKDFIISNYKMNTKGTIVNEAEAFMETDLEITLDNIDNFFTPSYADIDFLEYNNLFLACLYNEQSEIDLNTILYYGLGNKNNELTSEECSTLNNYFDSSKMESIGLTKISESDLNDYLEKKIGLKVNEFKSNLNYKYVEKYKAYYRYRKTDTIIIYDLNFKSVEKTGNNSYKAVYTRDNEENIEYEVNFKVSNGILQFISNKQNMQINKTGEVNISDGYLNVRESPSQSGKVIGKLYDGDTVKITGKFNDWYEIEFDGKNGYVFKDLIKIVDKNVSTKPSETYKDESTDLVDFQTTDGLYIGINNVFITGVYTDEINSYGFDIYNYDNLLLYDNKFYQMYNNQYISGETYSGKYEVDENNQLILSYKNAMRSSFNIGNGTHYLSYDIFYEIKDYFDLKDNIYNNSKITYDEYLKDANDNKYIFDTKVSMFNLYDEIKYMPSPYCYHIDKKQNNTGWKEVSDNKIYNIKGYFKDGYDKDEFIVAEQKGYTIDNMNNSNDFVLKYDNSKLSANKCNVVITFKNGYYETSSTCKEYDGYKGKYEFFSRNLIKIHAPENYKNNEQVYNFLYLDFEKKQVYLPLYYKYLSNESEIKSTYEELEDRITKKLLD